jgi:hypothetical protein
MTQSTSVQQVEPAGQRAAAKLQVFLDGLTPDEHQALERGLRRLVAPADASMTDTAGYMSPGMWTLMLAQLPRQLLGGPPLNLLREP